MTTKSSKPFNIRKLPETVNQSLTPQQKKILTYVSQTKTGSISAREAMFDLDITSATLSSRICEMERIKKKAFTIVRDRRTNPHTKKHYTRYLFRNA